MGATSRARDDQRLLIGAFLFDPASGELRQRAAAGGAESVRRLAPQAAQLLALLAERPGELVSHDAIRQRLWSGVEVDFEQGLHFQVRQVRAALGDTARRSRYIENLPRRGYRLLQPVLPATGVLAEPRPEKGSSGAPERPHGPRIRALAVALGTVLIAVVALRFARSDAASSDGALPDVASSDGALATEVAGPSLAIMPFAPPEGVSMMPDPRGVADRLLLRLGEAGPRRLAVIGPTTTAAYASDLRSIDRMARELDVDYVLNGRWLDDPETGKSLLVELIRSSDRAHVWVELFPELVDLDAVAATIAAATRTTLTSPRSDRPEPGG